MELICIYIYINSMVIDRCNLFFRFVRFQDEPHPAITSEGAIFDLMYQAGQLWVPH